MPAADAEGRNLSRLHIGNGGLKKKPVCSACLAAVQSVRFAEASLSILWLPACVLFLQPGCQNNEEVRNMVSPCSFSQLSQTKTLSRSLPPVFLWSGTIASFQLHGSVYLAIRHQFISCNCSVKSAIYTSAHLVGIAGCRSGNYRLGLTPFCWRDELEADGVHNQMSEIARYLFLFFLYRVEKEPHIAPHFVFPSNLQMEK